MGSLFAQLELGTVDHYMVPGSHVGDTDCAVWRLDTTPGQRRFLVRSSIDTATTTKTPDARPAEHRVAPERNPTPDNAPRV